MPETDQQMLQTRTRLTINGIEGPKSENESYIGTTLPSNMRHETNEKYNTFEYHIRGVEITLEAYDVDVEFFNDLNPVLLDIIRDVPTARHIIIHAHDPYHIRKSKDPDRKMHMHVRVMIRTEACTSSGGKHDKDKPCSYEFRTNIKVPGGWEYDYIPRTEIAKYKD